MVLIYTSELKGHYLEYIHHLWIEINNQSNSNKYVIAIPKKEWESTKHLLSWPISDKIQLRLLKDDELNINTKFPLFKRSIKETLIISKLIKEFDLIEEIIILNLAITLPFIKYLVPRNIKIKGIVYTIKYYTKYHNKLSELKEYLYIRILARGRQFGSIYLLNAYKPTIVYNKQFNTSNFKYLVDPVPKVDFSNIKNLRESLKISSEDIVFLHFGVMQRRKGTIEILNAILSIEDNSNKAYIFAGTVTEDIKDEFYTLTKIIVSRGIKIIVIDKFVKFENLMDLCYSSDCILAPYQDTACSSGVIGYGAVFNKPIIGSNTGLLNDLIQEFELGITTFPTSVNLASAIVNFKKYKTSSSYSSSHTIQVFSKTILE